MTGLVSASQVRCRALFHQDVQPFLPHEFMDAVLANGRERDAVAYMDAVHHTVQRNLKAVLPLIVPLGCWRVGLT